MKFFTQCKVAIFFLIPLVTFAQSPNVDRQSFLSLSSSLAYEFGKTYQMGKNCNKDLGSLAPQKVAGLFINYMKENEVQNMMNDYGSGSKIKYATECEREELKAVVPILQKRLAYYIQIASPFMRPYTER